MAQSEQIVEAGPSQSEGPRTLKQVFEDVFDSMEGNDEARAALKELEESYTDERLDIIFDTQREIAELRQEIETSISNDSRIDDVEKGYIDSQIDRERIEDTINSKVEGIETISDLRQLSFEKLLGLEEKYEGIMFYAFTDFPDANTKLDFENYYSWYKAPKEGDSFSINFYGNEEANSRIGAGDIFPPTVRGVTVYPGGKIDDSDPEKRVSTRRLGLKGDGNHANSGFFDAQGYIVIYSGYKVVVGSVDMSFDQKYRKEAGSDGRLGELDYAAYERDHAQADSDFVGALPAGARRGKYHGGETLDRSTRRDLGLRKNLPAGNIRRILDKVPDLHRYTSAAREKYRAKTGIDIPENIMYGVAKVESSFKVCAANPTSSARGLYQFVGSTWNNFLAANPWVYEKMNKDATWRNVDQMDWRFNPEIITYAAYWLATTDLTYLHKHRGEAHYSRFDNSAFAKSHSPSPSNPMKLSVDDTWILYLTHHDGAGGALNRLQYLGERERGTSEAVAAKRAGLVSWQGYSKGKLSADKDARLIVGIANKAMKAAKSYGDQLSGYSVSESTGNWGWGQEYVSAGPPESVSYYKDTGNLERISRNPHIRGKTLYVGSSSTVGYTRHMGNGEKPIKISKVGRGIDVMRQKVAKMKTAELKQCDRVIIQGGIKNVLGSGSRTDAQREAAYRTSIEAMQGMVDDIRSRAPGVKIYVQETVPWTPENTAIVRKYNDWINSGLTNVDGVIPIYQIMSDERGLWDERFGSSHSGDTLHCRKNKWFAGIVADWVARKESGEAVSESRERLGVRADQVRLVGDSLMWHARSGIEVGGQTTPTIEAKSTLMHGKRADELLEGVRAAASRGELDDLQIAVLEGGANNFNPSETTGRTPPVGPFTAEQVQGYFQEMIDIHKRENPGVRIVLVTIPPVKGCTEYMVEGGYEQTLAVNEWMRRKAASDPNITLVDVYKAAEDPARPGHMRSEYDMGDGLHFSGRNVHEAGSGKAFYADLIERGIVEADRARMEQMQLSAAQVETSVSSARNSRATDQLPYRTFGTGNVYNGGFIGFEGGSKTAFSRRRAESQIKYLYSRGVRTIINLASENGEETRQVREIISSLGFAIDYQVKVVNVSDDFNDNKALFELVGAKISDGKGMYIHCRHGAHRAPFLTAGGFLASGKVTSLGDAFSKAGLSTKKYEEIKATKLLKQLIDYADSKGIAVEREYRNRW